ncbi:DUF2972 domain-containing protein, partial [Campylobacter novaezeelandiae]
PYPSLLDPNKLKDINEELNYHSIDANLAWELNLPLPDNYEFVWFFNHGSGACALMHFLFLLGNFNTIDYFCGGEGNIRYIKFYNRLLELRGQRNIITINDIAPDWYGGKEKRDKLFFSFIKITPVLFQIRDPMELIKHAYGRKWGSDLAKTREFDLSYNFEDVVKDIQKYSYNLPDTLDGQKSQNFFWRTLKDCFFRFKDYTYLDVSQIKGERTIQTLKNLAQEFKFKEPNKEQEIYLTREMFGGNLYFLLPLTLYANKEDLYKKRKNEILNKSSQSIVIHIQALNHNTDFIDLYQILDIPVTKNLIGIYIHKDDYRKLQNDNEFFKRLSKYLKEFISKLHARIEIEDDLMLKTTDVLEHLRANKKARLSAKSILDEELTYIKQQRPDIVASWKYYQEFEKMCEELDGGS